MNKEEYDKLSTFDKIDYDIAMKLYFEYNDKIATINDHLGEMYDYTDLREAEDLCKQEELHLYRDALKDKCDTIDKAIEYIEENCSADNRLSLKIILKGGSDESK